MLNLNPSRKWHLADKTVVLTVLILRCNILKYRDDVDVCCRATDAAAAAALTASRDSKIVVMSSEGKQ